MKKLIALMLALVMVLALAACSTAKAPATDPAPETDPAPATDPAPENEEPDVTVMTFAEFEAADLDTAVVVETYVQAFESWWDGKMNLYCQDETGAYYVYGLACTEEEAAKFVPGTKIRVSGYKAAWSGEVEIIDATAEILEGTYFVEEATDVTALMGAKDLEGEQNKLVAVKGLTVAASKTADEKEVAFLYKWDGSGAQGDDLYFNVELEGKVYTFTVNVYMNGTGVDSEVYKTVEGLKIGDKIDVEGFLYWYNGAQPHLTSVTVVE